VETGIGFGDRKAGSVRPRHDRRQHPLALLPGAEHDHGIESEDIHVHSGGARHAGTRLRYRAHHDRSFKNAEAGAAIFLGDTDAEPTGIRQRPMKIGGVTTLLVLLQPIGVVEARAYLCNRVTDRFLVGSEREIHGIIPWWNLMRLALRPRA